MLGIEDKPSLRVVWTGLAGAIASLLTQPLEVIKTNRINTPSMVYWDLHQKIVSNGWKTYMRGRYKYSYKAQSQSSGRHMDSLSTLSSCLNFKTEFSTNFQLLTSFTTIP
jgi:hypothetical protein